MINLNKTNIFETRVNRKIFQQFIKNLRSQTKNTKCYDILKRYVPMRCPFPDTNTFLGFKSSKAIVVAKCSLFDRGVFLAYCFNY